MESCREISVQIGKKELNSSFELSPKLSCARNTPLPFPMELVLIFLSFLSFFVGQFSNNTSRVGRISCSAHAPSDGIPWLIEQASTTGDAETTLRRENTGMMR